MQKSFILALLIISTFTFEFDQTAQLINGACDAEFKAVEADVDKCIDDWTDAADYLAKAIYYFT